MTNKQSVQNLQSEMINKVKEKVSSIDNKIVFNNIFSVYVSENHFDDDVRVQYAVEALLPDGVVIGTSFGDDVEINLAELDIYEISHILDELESGNYKMAW